MKPSWMRMVPISLDGNLLRWNLDTKSQMQWQTYKVNTMWHQRQKWELCFTRQKMPKTISCHNCVGYRLNLTLFPPSQKQQPLLTLPPKMPSFTETGNFCWFKPQLGLVFGMVTPGNIAIKGIWLLLPDGHCHSAAAKIISFHRECIDHKV